MRGEGVTASSPPGFKVCTPCWYQDLKDVARQFKEAVPEFWEDWMWTWVSTIGTEQFAKMFYGGCRDKKGGIRLERKGGNISSTVSVRGWRKENDEIQEEACGD